MSSLHIFIARIEPLQSASEALYDAFFNEAIEQGGTFEPAAGFSTIDLHGVRVRASRIEHAMSAWLSAAIKMRDAEVPA